MTEEKLSYSGKKVFVGIDVHRSSYAVAAICEGVVVKRWRMESIPIKLVEKLGSYFAGATLLTGYEAGFSGFHLHRVFSYCGIENYVIHPGSIEVSSRDRVKTDRRDSLKIATQLSSGRLKCIRIPTEEEELAREYSRLRQQHKETRAKNES